MLTCRLSELVETIERATVPKWLHEYVQENRAVMIDGLNRFGEYTIPIPSGGQILIRCEVKAESLKPRRPIRPNCF
jgi:hypothetical protein